jgi:voltage-gated potassium channel
MGNLSALATLGRPRGMVNDDSPRARARTLAGYESWSEIPMQLLGFAWLGLLVLELTSGLSTPLAILSTAIWIVFIVDFAIRLSIAPDRRQYLRRNWLTALSLLVPALRVLRIVRFARVLRVARVTRGVRLVRVVTSVNRGMKALSRTMGRRGLAYVVVLTVIITFAGAAGMYAFERDAPSSGLGDFATALWWTAMIMTTMGTEYWPQTGEGRVLALLLSLYAFSVFGYVTAALASHFIDRDADRADSAVAGRDALREVKQELAALRRELERSKG